MDVDGEEYVVNEGNLIGIGDIPFYNDVAEFQKYQDEITRMWNQEITDEHQIQKPFQYFTSALTHFNSENDNNDISELIQQIFDSNESYIFDVYDGKASDGEGMTMPFQKYRMSHVYCHMVFVLNGDQRVGDELIQGHGNLAREVPHCLIGEWAYFPRE